MRVPGGGASCLGVGRPGSGALPPPTARPLGGLPGPTTHWLWVRGGAGVRGWALSQPRLPALWAGCWGPLPTGRGCGVRACGSGCPWHLVPCRVSWCVVRASRVRGTRSPLWLGTCPRAVVVAGGVPLWRASWPRVGAPLPVRSGRSRCSGRLSRRRGAFLHPGGCRPRLYWVAARGTWRPAENRAHCACRWPLPRQGRWARSASYLFGAPRWGCYWRVPSASVSGCVRCSGLACGDPVMGSTGTGRFLIKEMCMSTNERSSDPAVRPRATRFTRILLTSGSCRQIRTFINTTSMCRCSNFLSPIKTGSQAAHQQNVHWRDYASDAVIVDTALSLVTAEAVPIALQIAFPTAVRASTRRSTSSRFLNRNFRDY